MFHAISQSSAKSSTPDLTAHRAYLVSVSVNVIAWNLDRLGDRE
jgi:hypothetical protein